MLRHASHLSAVLLTALACGTAAAQTFSGAHVDALAGWSSDDGIGNRPFSGGDRDGFVYGAGAGYDLRRGRAVVGIVGEVSDVAGRSCRTVDYPAQPAASPAIKGRLCGGEGRTVVAGLRGGYVVGVDNLLYATIGYANKRLRGGLVGTVDGVTSSVENNRNLDGIRAGGGFERAFGDHLSLKAEYRYTAVGHDLTSGQHQVVGGIGFRF